VSDGVLSRRLDPQDNRYTLIALTASGHSMVAELQAAHSAFQTRLLDGIAREEQEIMVRALEKLRNNVRTIQQIRQEEE
jgi:DNA-binding MarR family transcriptional regulator